MYMQRRREHISDSWWFPTGLQHVLPCCFVNGNDNMYVFVIDICKVLKLNLTFNKCYQPIIFMFLNTAESV